MSGADYRPARAGYGHLVTRRQGEIAQLKLVNGGIGGE
jgi:myo-inositol-hexaphosphate 3-phosphohydrolase